MSDRLAVKKRALDDLLKYASQGQAKELKAKYGKKPEPAPVDAAPVEAQPEAPFKPEELDEDTLAELLG